MSLCLQGLDAPDHLDAHHSPLLTQRSWIAVGATALREIYTADGADQDG